MKNFLLLLVVMSSSLCSYSQEKFVEIGDASYYADYLDGRSTASGEIFSQAELTTAHKTLPFGSFVKLTNLTNGKTVVLRVNDRGPFKVGRIVDISRAAAKKLDFLMEGHVNVKLELLDKKIADVSAVNKSGADSLADASLSLVPEDEIKYEQKGQLYYRLISKTQTPKGYGLQLGCYTDVENVISFANKVRELTRMPVFVTCNNETGKNVYKIFAGEISTEQKARNLKTHVTQLFSGAFIVKY